MTTSNVGIIFMFILVAVVIVAVVIAAVMKNKRGPSSKPRSASGTILTVIVALSAAGLLAGLLLPVARRSHVTQTHVTVSREIGSVAVSTGTEEMAVSSERIATSEAPAPTPPESNRQDSEAEGRGTWLSRIANSGAVAVLITLAYLFLDAGTRGRYTWPLRFGSIAVFAGFCVLLWRLRPVISVLGQ